MKLSLAFLFVLVGLMMRCAADEPCENLNENLVSSNTIKILDSLSYYKNKLNADLNNPIVMLERAKYYVRQGEIDLAIADLNEVLAIDSLNLAAHELFADVHLATLDLETSKYHYEYILGSDSTNSAAFLGLARIYAALNNYGAADSYISRSLETDPYSPEPYFTRGLIYRSDWYGTGRESSWDIAVSSFQTAIEQESNYYAAYMELGVMHAEIGDSIALEYYNSALEIYPESIEAWYNKGYYYQARGEVDNALNSFYRLKHIDSTWYKSYYNLGFIHLIMTAEIDSALYYFHECTKWDPVNYEAFNNLGLAYEKQGNIDNAKKYYQKAVEINPDYQLAKDNLNVLQ